MNPWPMIGGVANVVCLQNEFVKPNYGQPGDVLILTKPLGTQPAVNLKQKLSAEQAGGPSFLEGKSITAEQIDNAYYMAMESMAHLNKDAADLMRKYDSHGATDVTGFGIMGHAQNLAAAQVNNVDLVIDRLPILDQMNRQFDDMPNFRLMEGFSAETSGGILCMISKSKAGDFIREAQEEFGHEVWTVGKVVSGSKKAHIRPDIEVHSVSKSFLS
jgi:selenide, water dikinase